MRWLKIWWAKFRYWRSLGFDLSEMPEARDKENERLRRLRHRIGDEEFAKFMNRHYRHWGRDLL